jgi:hypothetical protein
MRVGERVSCEVGSLAFRFVGLEGCAYESLYGRSMIDSVSLPTEM